MAEYIEREAALADIEEEEKNHEFSDRDVLSGMYIAEDCVRKVPAADVAPVRHGRWELIRPGEWTATLRCSECRRRITVDPKRCELEKEYPYCHCGAKMDGGGRGGAERGE